MFQGSQERRRGQALRDPAEDRRRRASTARRTPIARTTSRWCRRTSSRPRCGSRAIAWATCSSCSTAEEPRQPDRRRAQRAAPELRQRAVRQGAVRAVRGAVPRGPPVSLPDDRQARGPRDRVARRREGLLQDLVRAGERDARDRRRLRRRATASSSSRSGSARSRRARSRRSVAVPAPAIAGQRGRRSTTSFAKLRQITFAWHSPANYARRRRRARHRRRTRSAREGRGRLYKALVYDTQLAQSVSARARAAARSPACSTITVTLRSEARPRRGQEDRRRRGRAARARSRCRDKEIARVVAANEACAIRRLETRDRRARTCCRRYNHYLGDPGQADVGPRSLPQDDRRRRSARPPRSTCCPTSMVTVITNPSARRAEGAK